MQSAPDQAFIGNDGPRRVSLYVQTEIVSSGTHRRRDSQIVVYNGERRNNEHHEARGCDERANPIRPKPTKNREKADGDEERSERDRIVAGILPKEEQGNENKEPDYQESLRDGLISSECNCHVTH